MTSIKDAIKNFEAKEAKKAADAGLPEPPKAPEAERVLLCVISAPFSEPTHKCIKTRFILLALLFSHSSLNQVRPAAAHSKNGQHSGYSQSLQAPGTLLQRNRSYSWPKGHGFSQIAVSEHLSCNWACALPSSASSLPRPAA